MGGKDSNYSVVYRGETLEYFKEGEWVFFQRSKQSGGGFSFRPGFLTFSSFQE
jgi:hypothetical protein